MRSRVKTGDVIQIRQNGPNYIALGKVRNNEGVEFIAATRNGNITTSGKFKKALPGAPKPKVHVIPGYSVKRVHGNRAVDLESVASQDRVLGRHLTRTTRSSGVNVDAPNLIAQLAELQAGL